MHGHRLLATEARRQLLQVAGRQHGVFGLWQAVDLGIPAGWIESQRRRGLIDRALPRVYRLIAVPPSGEQRLWAAYVWAREGIVSHRSAAAWWALDGFEAGPVDLTVPHRFRSPAAGIILHRAGDLDPASFVTRGGMHVTTPARTLLDLGKLAPIERVEEALEAALRGGLTSVDALRTALDRWGGRGRPGTSVLRELLAYRSPGAAATESVLELRLERILRRAGLPPEARQYSIYDGEIFVARVDLAYPSARVAVEADGYAYHSSRRAWLRDRWRLNALTRLDWSLLAFTARDIDHHPAAIAPTVSAALATRSPEGWQRRRP